MAFFFFFALYPVGDKYILTIYMIHVPKILTNVGDTEPKMYCMSQRCINLKISKSSGEELSGASCGNRVGWRLMEVT